MFENDGSKYVFLMQTKGNWQKGDKEFCQEFSKSPAYQILSSIYASDIYLAGGILWVESDPEL
jgi:hypothetical protein